MTHPRRIPTTPDRDTTTSRRQFSRQGVSASLALAFAALLGRSGRALAAGGPAEQSLINPTQTFGAFAGSAFVAPSEELGLLNRISFGPTSAALDEVRAMGVDAYIDDQLRGLEIPAPEFDQGVLTRFPFVDKDAAFFRDSNEFDITNPDDRDEARRQLKAATLYRALYSPRQLYEVMVEFWSNHFSIFHGDTPVAKTVDDFQVIRPHALGSFADMLAASARSPAMLTYLDNFLNVAGGINENYARELMELHTIGVDGGYDDGRGFSDLDVEEVAKCLTGWGIDDRPNLQGEFRFNPDLHINDEARTVLGIPIPPGGIEQGDEVLRILGWVRRADTGRLLATKLCQRFVSDTPSLEIIDAVADAYATHSGDIRETLRVLLFHPEFRAAMRTDSKVKRPYTYVASLIRASGADVLAVGLDELGALVGRLGQGSFAWEPPNGYPDVAGYWINTNSMLTRWSAALLAGGDQMPGVDVDVDTLSENSITARGIVDALARNLVRRTLSGPDRTVLMEYAANGVDFDEPLSTPLVTRARQGVFGLLAGSAYFQTR